MTATKKYLRKLLNIMRLKMDNYYDKLKALLEGLEIEKINDLLANGDADTYRTIGEMIARQCKFVKKDGVIKNGN
jgi:hypothetical protein